MKPRAIVLFGVPFYEVVSPWSAALGAPLLAEVAQELAAEELAAEELAKGKA